MIRTNRGRVAWSFCLILCTYLLSTAVPRVAPTHNASAPSPFHIQVGPYDVIISPNFMPCFLYEWYPEAEGHPVVEDFISRFNPVWIESGIYYNESVGAPTHVGAGILVAFNQSGFWQLVFSTNGTQSTEIQWTCTVSGHRMPVNTSTILITGIERLLTYLPEEPIKLHSFYLSAVGWGNYAINGYHWHLWFVIETKPWSGFFVTIATNGTVIDEELLIPPGGGNTFPPALPLLIIAAVGVIVLVFVIVGFIRFQSLLTKWQGGSGENKTN